MNWFQYHNKELFAESFSLRRIATDIGTPCYVYSATTIQNNWLAFQNAFKQFPHRICYAVKANSNLSILKLLADMGSGFDIVSVGELERVLLAGGDPDKIVFSGVGKQASEIKRALEVGIYCFNVESEAELEGINDIAASLQKIANISLRVNPNIDPRTHHYIATGLNKNKFGLELSSILTLAKKIQSMPHLNLMCIGAHIGSQLTQIEPFIETLDCLLSLLTELRQLGFNLKNINIGGGLGIRYQNETPPTISNYISALIDKIAPFNLEVIIEPGRSIVGETGILLTKIEYLKHNKHKHFAIVDSAMNDFMRPSLYDAWHDILPVFQRPNCPERIYDIVGPVCESSDFLGKDRKLALEVGDLLVVATVGAYGFSMSSNYNSRPRPAEVLLLDNKIHLITKRETLQDLFRNEQLIK